MKIDRYILQDRLGQGGTAMVYLGQDTHLNNRTVAVKLLRDRLLEDQDARDRFLREAELVADLKHPSILPIWDYGELDNYLYIVMPYMPNGSLRDKLVDGPINFTEALDLLRQVASALDAAHENQIVHRDVKPHNVLLGEYGRAYLCDFGVARLLDQDKPEQTVTLIGTPEYMAPEQVLEGGISSQTDIYQFGVLAFQVLTGQRPFEGAVHNVMTQHLHNAVPSAEALNPDLPAGTDGVLAHCMAKKAEDRYSTAAEFIHALDALQFESQPLPALAGASSGETRLGTALRGLTNGVTAPTSGTQAPSRWRGTLAWAASGVAVLGLITTFALGGFGGPGGGGPGGGGNGPGGGGGGRGGGNGAVLDDTIVVDAVDSDDVAATIPITNPVVVDQDIDISTEVVAADTDLNELDAFIDGFLDTIDQDDAAPDVVAQADTDTGNGNADNDNNDGNTNNDGNANNDGNGPGNGNGRGGGNGGGNGGGGNGNGGGGGGRGPGGGGNGGGGNGGGN